MTDVLLQHMFHVPIFTTKITPWDEIKQQILSHVEESDYHTDDLGFKTDYYRNNYNAPVYEILKPFINQITKDHLGIPAPTFPPNMWTQKYYSGSEHTIHNHGNRGYSFILYLKFDPEVHKATRFFSPFDHFFTGEMLSYTPPVNEGDLIAFPSVIKHTSQQQMTDKERMVLAFNMYHPPA